MRLYINIDHVATVRQARRTDEPDPVRAAVLAELGGADGITVHLREDRRHIQDRDVELLLKTVRSMVNLEIAATPEMADLATRLKPAQVTLVPERREEITTEGGLAVTNPATRKAVDDALNTLRAAGIRTSLFVDPDPQAMKICADSGAEAVELHTGEFANARGAARDDQVRRLRSAAELASSLALAVHAGHGLTYLNTPLVAGIAEVEELNIGHSIVSHAVFVGMERAVREMKELVAAARRVH